LARGGLYVSACGLLRSALEQVIWWEYTSLKNQPKGRLARRLPMVGPMVSANLIEAYEGLHPPRGSKGRRFSIGFREMVSKVETETWYRACLHGIYSRLAMDIHPSPSSFGKVYAPEWKDDGAKEWPKAITIPCFGKHQDIILAYSPLGFFIFWAKIAARLLSKIAADFPQMTECVDKVLPAPTAQARAVDLSQVVNKMWEFPQRKAEALNLANGKIVQLAVAGKPVRLITEDAETLMVLDLPICARDYMLGPYISSGQLPIPPCSLFQKWELADEASGLLDAESKKNYDSRFGTPDTRNRLARGAFEAAEAILNKKLGSAWEETRHRFARKWFAACGVTLI